MGPQQRKEAIEAALANLEKQLLEQEVKMSLNDWLWKELERQGGELKHKAAKERRDAQLQLKAIQHGIGQVQQDFAEVLVWEPPSESEAPEGDASPTTTAE